MRTTAIIPGGGQGLRMETKINKQFLEIDGKPIIAHTLEKMCLSPLIDNVFVVVPADWIDFIKAEVVHKFALNKVTKVIPGGATRQESVLNGLKELYEKTELVAVHDAVRPFVPSRLIDDVIKKAETTGAAILAVPSQDTVKIVKNGVVKSTPDRRLYWRVQTPQVFKKEIILKAYNDAINNNFIGTDDASLVEKTGLQVAVVEGSYSNIKITNPDDLDLAEFLLQQQNKISYIRK